MCGRYTMTTPSIEIMKRFGINGIPFDYHPRYNIAPGQMVPAIISDSGTKRIGQLKWGFIPSWAKSEILANALNKGNEHAK